MRLRCYNFRYAMRLMTLSQRLPVSQNPPICWGDAGGFASLRHALTRPAIGYCHCDARLLNKARQPEAGYHYRAHHADRGRPPAQPQVLGNSWICQDHIRSAGQVLGLLINFMNIATAIQSPTTTPDDPVTGRANAGKSHFYRQKSWVSRRWFPCSPHESCA
jgi:hypothetical protein